MLRFFGALSATEVESVFLMVPEIMKNIDIKNEKFAHFEVPNI